MKKLLYIIATGLLLTACTKNAEQIDIAKKKLAEAGTTDLENYKYKVAEVKDAEAYRKIAGHYLELYDINMLNNTEDAKSNLEDSKSYIEKAKHPENKIFFQVDAYQLVATDTVHKKIVFLNDKNAVLYFANLK